MENLKQIRTDINRRKLINAVFAIVGLLIILVATLILLALTIQMMIQGSSRLTLEFFLSFPSRRPEDAGILSAWVGTSLVMLVTAAAAVPLGIASGIYLEEYSRKNWLADLIEINVTNLAGVPSIVYGLLALGLFVYKFNLGESVLAAGLTLALLILPVVIVTTREALRAIPTILREAAYALGASKWRTIWDHILPYSFGSILTGVIIGLSRAIGETAPVITIGALTFIAFLPDSPFKEQFPYISFAWLKAPFTVMPIQMFNWVSRPESEFEINAAAAGTVLILMTLAMNGIAIYLRYRLRKGLKW
jgi:phosphate transport system permease protein